MPPRVPIAGSSWASLILPTRPRLDPHLLPFRQFSSRPARRAADTYLDRQREAYELALRSRENNLEAAKQSNIKPSLSTASPIHGEPTQFVRDFDEPQPAHIDLLTGESRAAVSDPLANKLNFRLEADQVQQQLQRSRDLTLPIVPPKPDIVMDLPDEQREKIQSDYQAQLDALAATHDAEHAQASVAINRIINLSSGSSKDRMRVNFDKCIAHFGRHNTDHTLLSKNGTAQVPKVRAGKDVGSSEVQCAILTVKIRNLAKLLEIRGRHDHHNKRNLRIMVHKRQKMLKYLRRRERGGPRWQHLISTLGLTESTWNGEIRF